MPKRLLMPLRNIVKSRYSVEVGNSVTQTEKKLILRLKTENMPLSFGLRDEHNERINNALQRLMALTHVPEGWNDDAVNDLLKAFILKVDILKTISAEELADFLVKYKVDWANMEQFADVLLQLSAKAGYETLKEKGRSLYKYIQAESGTFSFEIMNKLNALQ